MPIYVYRHPDGREEEHLFWSFEDAPKVLENGAVRVPARTVVKFRGKFSEGTSTKDMVNAGINLGPDSSIVEPGMKREVKEKRRRLEKQRDEARRNVIRDTMATAY